MKLNDFKSLEELPTKGVVILTNGKYYAEDIYESNIPFRPGVYLVYSLNKEGEDQDLLYYGKAGVTNNSGILNLNFHQLPERLLAASAYNIKKWIRQMKEEFILSLLRFFFHRLHFALESMQISTTQKKWGW